MQLIVLKKNILKMINNLKGENIICLDVGKMNNCFIDVMIICSGTSNRHVISMSQDILYNFRKIGIRPRGVEGMKFGEWILVDFNNIIIHIMQHEVRILYALEKIWS